MKPIRVLVIDDLADVRRSLQRALERDGFEVLTAGSGEEAMGLLRAQNVDAVLMDLRMPTMSGRTLYQLIRSQWPAVAERVAVMSGDPEDDEHADWLALHGLPVLAKPFRLEDVRKVVFALAARGGSDAHGRQA